MARLFRSSYLRRTKSPFGKQIYPSNMCETKIVPEVDESKKEGLPTKSNLSIMDACKLYSGFVAFSIGSSYLR
jgi:hypothetical protein